MQNPYREMAHQISEDIERNEAMRLEIDGRLAQLRSALESIGRLAGDLPPAAPSLSYSGRRRASTGNVVDVSPVESAPAPDMVALPSPAVAAAPVKAGRKSKAKAAKKASTRVPTGVAPMGRDFWPKVMGRKKFTIAELTEAALARMELGEDARKVVANRLNAWMYPAVTAGKVAQKGERDGKKLYQLAVA
jgi:hypothetical protein